MVADDSVGDLHEAVRPRCLALDYVFVPLDAAALRVHMPQDIFFGIARRLDWRQLARRRVLRLAAELDYTVDGVDPRARAMSSKP